METDAKIYNNPDIYWRSINRYNEYLKKASKCSDKFLRAHRLMSGGSNVASVGEVSGNENRYEFRRVVSRY